MNNTKNDNAEAVRSSAWLGALPECDGWYAAYFPPQGHETIVRVRYDGERGERVVDVVGQPTKQSEELWRYKEWVWSDRLTLTAPNQQLTVAENLRAERDEAMADLEFRRELFKVQENYLEKARKERDEAREKYCEVLTDNMLHIATITRLERERDEAKLFIDELVDLVAYGLGQQESIWSLDAMRKATEAITKAKNF